MTYMLVVRRNIIFIIVISELLALSKTKYKLSTRILFE